MTTFSPQLEERFRNDFLELKRRLSLLEHQTGIAVSGSYPIGPAGGDLAGGYPNPSVAAVDGVVVTGGSPSAGMVLQATGPAAAAWAHASGAVVAAYSIGGDVPVGAGDFRWYNDTGAALTFGTVRASAGVAPTGAALIVDILAGGTTIFTTSGNRPAIAAGTNTATNAAPPDVATLAAGQYLTVSIAQVGSMIPGADLTVTVVMT